MAQPEERFPVFLEKAVLFPDGTSYELLKPLTNFRSCHDGTPAEARIVFTCRRTDQNSVQQRHQNGDLGEDQFVMKVKVQYLENSSPTQPKALTKG